MRGLRTYDVRTKGVAYQRWRGLPTYDEGVAARADALDAVEGGDLDAVVNAVRQVVDEDGVRRLVRRDVPVETSLVSCWTEEKNCFQREKEFCSVSFWQLCPGK